jgi:hypothetical protein
MLDLPGIIEGAKDGKGRGRQVISTARTCNLILIVLDCLKPLTHKKVRSGLTVSGPHHLCCMRRRACVRVLHDSFQTPPLLGACSQSCVVEEAFVMQLLLPQLVEHELEGFGIQPLVP